MSAIKLPKYYAQNELPTNDTAIKAALAAERNRCVTELLSRHANGNRKYDTLIACVNAIRALGDSRE